MFNVKKILVPFDFSKYSDAALARATDLATRFNAELHLLYVVGDAHEETRRHAIERLEQVLEPDVVLKLNVTHAAIPGPPGRAILHKALDEDFDLIVMGTHGRTGFARIAIGSVAERVLRAAPCPVLVVRHPDQRRDLLWEAAKALGRNFGETLAGQLVETRAQMKDGLVQEFDISDEQADHLVAELERARVLIWVKGGSDEHGAAENHWRIESAALGQAKSQLLEEAKSVESAGGSAPALDLIRRALVLRATDIHIDPAEHDQYVIRFRIDGQLELYCRLDRDIAEHVIRQFKVLGTLDIAETFRPKEGRLQLPPELPDVEVRITTSRVSGGEATALRLFSRENMFHPLDRLGLSEHSLAAVSHMLRRGEGIVLVTGPTGSGKTTTVYSMLKILATDHRNIVSIEDPVEFAAPFVRQLVVDTRHGVTMTSGLRTLLRMDPDIIFIGEIRDAEAGDIGMRAASSGKYVFSTLHTRDVAGTVTALRDLNIDNRSLAANVTGIINQRLVRRLCRCREPVDLRDEHRQLFEANDLPPPQVLFGPKGCDQCRGTGYRERIGVFEAVLVGEEAQDAIARGLPESELRQVIRSSGTLGLTWDALRKVSDGITSITEAHEMRWA